MNKFIVALLCLACLVGQSLQDGAWGNFDSNDMPPMGAPPKNHTSIPQMLEKACGMMNGVAATSGMLSSKGRDHFNALWSSMLTVIREEFVNAVQNTLNNANQTVLAMPKTATLISWLGLNEDAQGNLMIKPNSSLTDMCSTASLATFKDFYAGLQPDELVMFKAALCSVKSELRRDMPDIMNGWIMQNLPNLMFGDDDMTIIKTQFNPFLSKMFTSAMRDPNKYDDCGRHH
jgi:hypothetical protein